MKLDYASRKAKRKANKLRRTYPEWCEVKRVYSVDKVDYMRKHDSAMRVESLTLERVLSRGE